MWLWCFPRWDMQLVTCQGLDVQKGFREKWSQHSCLQGSAVQHNFDLLRLFEYGYDDACSQFEEFWSENGLFEVQAIYENMGVRGSIPINKCPRWSRCTWHAACVASWVSEVCGPKPHSPSWNYWRICSRKQKAHWEPFGDSWSWVMWVSDSLACRWTHMNKHGFSMVYREGWLVKWAFCRCSCFFQLLRSCCVMQVRLWSWSLPLRLHWWA